MIPDDSIFIGDFQHPHSCFIAIPDEVVLNIENAVRRMLKKQMIPVTAFLKLVVSAFSTSSAHVRLRQCSGMTDYVNFPKNIQHLFLVVVAPIESVPEQLAHVHDFSGDQAHYNIMDRYFLGIAHRIRGQ